MQLFTGAKSVPTTALATFTAFIVLLLGGCTPESNRRPAPAEVRPGIPYPALAEMEPLVAKELEARRSELDALLAREDVSPAERENAIGPMGQIYHAHRLHDDILCFFGFGPGRFADRILDRQGRSFFQWQVLLLRSS